MNLTMTASAVGYTSGSQRARVLSESWAANNLYCVACDSNVVEPTPANTKAIDFVCPACATAYQLKAGKSWNLRRIPDGAYSTMMAAINGDRVPTLLVMQYAADLTVRNLMAVPSFVLSSSAIRQRRPLSATARRAGWIGCDILLSALPDTGKLLVVDAGAVRDMTVVRNDFARLRPLQTVAAAARGWTLDVLRIVQSLGRHHFSLADIYAFEARLSTLHPGNRNVRPKIRQQLQVLRDLGIIHFAGRGRYCVV